MAIQKLSIKDRSLYNSSGRPLDGLYGPWLSWEELYASINNVELSSVTDNQVFKMKSQFKQGVTVALIEGNTVVEYWKPSDKVGGVYPDGNDNGGFVIKSPNVEVDDSAIDKAVSDYLTKNPVTSVTDEQVENAVNKYLDENPVTVEGVTENDVKGIVEENLFTGEGDGKTPIYVPSNNINNIISGYLYDEDGEIYIQKSKISDASIKRLKYYGPWKSWKDFVTGTYEGNGNPYDSSKPGYVDDDTVTKNFLSNISSGVTVVIDGVEYWKPMDKDSVTGSYPQGGDDLGGFVPKYSFGYFVDDSDSDPYNDDYVEGAVKFSDFVERERVIAEALNDLNDRIKDTDVSKLSKEIKEVAEVSSSSIISLDTRIDQLEETLVKSVDKDGAGLLFYLVA